ncbi:MAG: hypothetical protein WC877_00535 [Dehalococcoidales bacterium]|jgi:flagellar hook assembly protein FlgD
MISSNKNGKNGKNGNHMTGRWDSKENDYDNKRHKTFVDRGDNQSKRNNSSKPNKSDNPIDNIVDKIKRLTNKDSEDIKYYRVFYIRTVDNKIDDVLVEHYETNESVYMGLVINSDHKMQRRKTDNGVVMFEWEGKPKDGKPVNYTAISYAIHNND